MARTRRDSLRGKPVCVIGASTGLFGAVWAQADARKILATIGADVIEEDLTVGLAHEAFDQEGTLADSELRVRLSELLAALTQRAAPDRAEATRC